MYFIHGPPVFSILGGNPDDHQRAQRTSSGVSIKGTELDSMSESLVEVEPKQLVATFEPGASNFCTHIKARHTATTTILG